VVFHQAQALIEAGLEVLVITGEIAEDRPDIPQVQVRELRYDVFKGFPSPPARTPGAEKPLPSEDVRKEASVLAEAVLAAMDRHWGGAADILHVHNPLIQKNSALLPALNILRKQGIRLLLQNHDLAEDFRPDVYTVGEDYPEDCHYAVINNRDYSFLHRAGLKPGGLHLLPNEVVPVAATPGLERNRCLYPVRAIRRKNIGEALFLSLFIPPGRKVAFTLPPTTEKDQGMYRRWVDFAGECELPAEFGIGVRESLADVFGSALCIISTSVKEGFGFSFLEPWTAGRAVIGRRIDYVCGDFEAAGLRFNALYQDIRIPMVYLAPLILRKKMERALTGIYEAFGQEPPRYLINMMGDELLSHDTVDFGRLDEESQEGIIRTVASNGVVLRDIVKANPFLGNLADWRPDEGDIAYNSRKVAEAYGKERIVSILKDTYQSVVDNPVSHRLSKSILLELYLDPLQMSLVGIGNV
jgi:glycosyltransferase involved in cell wall biosynthesis